MSIAASAVLSSLPASGLRQQAATQAPSRKWPFPPKPKSSASPDGARKMAPGQIVSRRDMLLDVLLVAAWGIAIPALMWLGAVAGF